MSRTSWTVWAWMVPVASIAALCSLGSMAHVKNEATQFPDIEYSEARFDIVVLVGAGIVPETPVFEPDAPLTRSDLAAWAALARGLGEGGETPNVQALARAALERGLVESLEGEATYQEIDQAIFGGEVAGADAAGTPTKAEAASYVASHLNAPAGEALLEARGLRGGPTGPVSAVEMRQTETGANAYFVTVGGTTLPFYAHGRVANGPTDLMQWQDRAVRRSFIRTQGDRELWAYLEAETAAGPAAPEQEHAHEHEDHAAAAPETDRRLMYGLIAAVPVLGVLLFFRRRKRR